MILKNVVKASIGVAVGTCAAWALLPVLDDAMFLALPTSRWMEVRSVQVGSVRHGEEVPIRVDRTIHRPFTAGWTATLQQEVRDGYVPFCTWHGYNDYRPNIVLPSQTSLSWFFDQPSTTPCRQIAPGRYVLTIVWNIEAEGLPARAIRADSNVFEISR